MTSKQAPRPPAAFHPVPVRHRADGWTPQRQTGFIKALAATANVEAAAREIGMTTASAYTLRARPDAASFREAWDVALEYAVRRLGDAVLERAVAGVATPVFYKGEQVGERRRYDERLAMFILRMRDPERFGSWREGRIPADGQDFAAARLHAAVGRVGYVAAMAEQGRDVAGLPPLPEPILLTADQKAVLDAQQAEEDAAREEDERRQRRRAERQARKAASAGHQDDAEVDAEGEM